MKVMFVGLKEFMERRREKAEQHREVREAQQRMDAVNRKEKLEQLRSEHASYEQERKEKAEIGRYKKEKWDNSFLGRTSNMAGRAATKTFKAAAPVGKNIIKGSERIIKKTYVKKRQRAPMQQSQPVQQRFQQPAPQSVNINFFGIPMKAHMPELVSPEIRQQSHQQFKPALPQMFSRQEPSRATGGWDVLGTHKSKGKSPELPSLFR